MAKDMHVKFDKYWSEFNVILSCAAVLDPRFKLERVEYYYEKLYRETYANEIISKIRITLFDLFDEYNVASSSNANNVDCFGPQMDDDLLDYKVFLSKKRKFDSDKNELELYLEEKNSEVTEKCNVLAYWNKSSVRYPNLACMAWDILSIPISTVPSESAFSMGKKLISPWRASLGEKKLKCLHVTKIGYVQKVIQ
ncbi:Zinc finger BED domain-containing protein RICESLEEPER 3 [Bienertia sinuspersici]